MDGESILITLLVAVKKLAEKLSEGERLFWLQFEGAAHHGKDAVAAAS